MHNSKKTPAVLEIIREALEKGSTHTAAYGLARVDMTTFYKWLREDPEFTELVKNAESVAEARWLEKTEKEHTGSRWLLSRRFRKDWSERIQHEHLGVVTVNVVRSDDEVTDTDAGPEDDQEV